MKTRETEKAGARVRRGAGQRGGLPRALSSPTPVRPLVKLISGRGSTEWGARLS